MVLRTGNWIAAVRARESDRPDRLFDDPFARALAGESGFAAMARSEGATGSRNEFIPVRVRWFDDAIAAAVAGGIRQVVLLGAGLDTRPYRLDWPENLYWYEVDRRDVFVAKAAGLAGARPRCVVRQVPAELPAGLATALGEVGFDAAARTLWVAEGLFFYLTEQSIVELLRAAADRSGRGSRFLVDVIGTVGLDGPAMRPYRQFCADRGLPPPFGHGDPAALLASGGFTAESVDPPGAPAANYGRLPPQPAGRTPGHTHLVSAILTSWDGVSPAA